jgi:hypothetical protein
MTADEPLRGVVRPGPPPAEAVRPEVVIRDENGRTVQAVVRLDDGTLVDVTLPNLGLFHPGQFSIAPQPWITPCSPASPTAPSARQATCPTRDRS